MEWSQTIPTTTGLYVYIENVDHWLKGTYEATPLMVYVTIISSRVIYHKPNGLHFKPSATGWWCKLPDFVTSMPH